MRSRLSRLAGQTARRRAAGGSLLLDAHPGAAAAYPLRRISSTYAGSALRVRRDLDDDELEIGYTAPGDLDTASLLSFVGAGSGYVATWYDPSGDGRDATQPAAAAQPTIVEAGVLVTEGTRPAVHIGGAQWLTFPELALTAFTLLVVARTETIVNGAQYVLGGVQQGLFLAGTASSVKGYGIAQGAITAMASEEPLTQSLYTAQNGRLGRNGIEATYQVAPDTSGLTLSMIGGRADSTRFAHRGTISELVIYPADVSADLPAIEADLNAYYGVY